MEDSVVIRLLSALAHEARLKVFRALVVAGGRGMTPGVMSEGAGLPAATLSFHLKELMNAGLVTQERAGRNLIYRAHYDQMALLVQYLMANCCQGEGCSTEVVASASCDC